MYARRPTNDADRHRHFQRADQVTRCVFTPGAQRGISPLACRVGVRASLDSAPVVPSGNRHGIYTVHDPFIMRRCAIWIHRSKRPGSNNPIAHGLGREFIESQLFQADATARSGQAPVGQVGKDTQVHLAAADLFHARGKSLQGGVDRICAHGVAYIIDQVHNEEWPDGRIIDLAYFQTTRPAAQPGQGRINPGSFLQQFALALQEPKAGRR